MRKTGGGVGKWGICLFLVCYVNHKRCEKLVGGFGILTPGCVDNTEDAVEVSI